MVSFNPSIESVMNHMLLSYKQVHQHAKYAQYNRAGPNHIIVAGYVMVQAAQPAAEERADLMGEEYNAAERGQVFNAKHIGDNAIG